MQGTCTSQVEGVSGSTLSVTLFLADCQWQLASASLAGAGMRARDAEVCTRGHVQVGQVEQVIAGLLRAMRGEDIGCIALAHECARMIHPHSEVCTFI